MIALLFVGAWAFPNSRLFLGSLPWWTYPLYAQNLMGDFTRAPLWIGVTWSLAVEEQFYLIFPAIVRLFSRKMLIAFLGLCIFGAPVLRTLLVMNERSFEQIYPLLPCRADALALGVAAALIMRSVSARAWIIEHRKFLYRCLLALFAVLPSMLKWAAFGYVGTIGYSTFAVTYFLLILLVLIAPLPVLTHFFRARWLRWMGMVSYCVYLIHQPVRAALFLMFGLDYKVPPAGLTTLLVTGAALLVTLGVAQGSWQLLEKRLIDRAHQRFRYLRAGSMAPRLV